MIILIIVLSFVFAFDVPSKQILINIILFLIIQSKTTAKKLGKDDDKIKTTTFDYNWIALYKILRY